jgi:CubicO group peptidase (beta-lactamase class C family)
LSDDGSPEPEPSTVTQRDMNLPCAGVARSLTARMTRPSRRRRAAGGSPPRAAAATEQTGRRAGAREGVHEDARARRRGLVTSRLAAFVILASASGLRAQGGAQGAELTRLLDSTRRATQMPAMAAAIVTRDSIVAYDVVGVRRTGDPTAVTRDDRFHIGSNTKAMTAGLVALLVDEGGLTWATTLAELFPELATRMRPEYRDVTVRDLLTHHSGLVRDASGDFGQGTGRERRERFVGWVLTRPPASPRGTLAYSNANYILAGAIVERLTGESYEQLVVRRLLAPLGLQDVRFGPPRAPGRSDQPSGHIAGAFGRWRADASEQTNPLYAPAGDMNLSVRDWALWARALLRAASGGPSPWKPETVAALLTPPVPADSMAMGWQVLSRPWARPGGRILVHTGTNRLHFSIAILAPETGFGILVMTNHGGAEGEAAVAGLANRLRAGYTSGME